MINDTWRTAGGYKIKMCDMDTTHLCNALRMVAWRPHAPIGQWYGLLREVVNRADTDLARMLNAVLADHTMMGIFADWLEMYGLIDSSIKVRAHNKPNYKEWLLGHFKKDIIAMMDNLQRSNHRPRESSE
jgi:hypothetical protein